MCTVIAQRLRNESPTVIVHCKARTPSLRTRDASRSVEWRGLYMMMQLTREFCASADFSCTSISDLNRAKAARWSFHINYAPNTIGLIFTIQYASGWCCVYIVLYAIFIRHMRLSGFCSGLPRWTIVDNADLDAYDYMLFVIALLGFGWMSLARKRY